MTYRVHLLDAQRNVIATDNFVAVSDEEALKVASLIFLSCTDVAFGCELWSGPEVIATEKFFPSELRSVALAGHLQHLVYEREEILQSSYRCLHESRLLLASLEFLQAVRGLG